MVIMLVYAVSCERVLRSEEDMIKAAQRMFYEVTFILHEAQTFSVCAGTPRGQHWQTNTSATSPLHGGSLNYTDAAHTFLLRYLFNATIHHLPLILAW